MTLGKLIGLSNADYHGADAVSHSKLETFRRRPVLYRKTYLDKSITREESAALKLGTATHCAVLEPEKFRERYAVKPDGIDRRTTTGKAAFAKFAADHAGKEILSGEDAATVREMTFAVMTHFVASQLIARGVPEISWRASSRTLPVPLQCRTDWFNAEGCELSGGRPYIADIKTVESLDAAEFRNFERAFYNFGYHRQAGFYLPLLYDCGVTCSDFFFIAVEKCEPFGVIVYKPTERAVAAGIDETLQDLAALSKCYSTGIWPNTPETVQEIDLPNWYNNNP